MERSAIATGPMTRAEYERLVQQGVFEGVRVELLFGAVVPMTPHGPAHDGTLEILADLLGRAAPASLRVRVQSSFAATDGSQPEPDIALVPRRDHRDAHPDQTLLIVEISVSSLDVDAGPKATLYAQAGVPEYWVVDVDARVVLVHTLPENGAYTRVERVGRGARLAPLGVPGVVLQVDAFL